MDATEREWERRITQTLEPSSIIRWILFWLVKVGIPIGVLIVLGFIGLGLYTQVKPYTPPQVCNIFPFTTR